MLRNTADSKADAERFVRRVTKLQVVWYLDCDTGAARCASNEIIASDQAPANVILFFSDAAYARRVRTRSFPEFEPVTLSLFDFLYRWLPGMSEDGILAGVNWTGDLIGLELDPLALRASMRRP